MMIFVPAYNSVVSNSSMQYEVHKLDDVFYRGSILIPAQVEDHTIHLGDDIKVSNWEATFNCHNA